MSARRKGAVLERPPAAVVAPRLLSLQQAADKLGISYWTMRAWVLEGRIRRVNLPPMRARDGDRQKLSLRRVVVDVHDVDAIIESWKTT